MVPDVLESVVGLQDRCDIGLEIGSGNIGGGLGGERRELGSRDGGGRRRPPADPRRRFGGVRVIEDRGQALARAATAAGGDIGVGIGSARGPP